MTKTNNLAYALRNFEAQESEAQSRPKIKKLENKRGKQTTKNRNAFRLVLGMLYVVALCGTLLLARTELYKESQKVQKAEAALESVDNEHERLSFEVDNITSLTAIEKKATEEYGMVKPDKNQVSHVRVEKSNKVEIQDDQDDLVSQFIRFVDQIKEYIGG